LINSPIFKEVDNKNPASKILPNSQWVTAALQAIGIKGEANTLDCATGLKPEAMEKPVDFVIRDSEPPKDDSKTTQSTDDSNKETNGSE